MDTAAYLLRLQPLIVDAVQAYGRRRGFWPDGGFDEMLAVANLAVLEHLSKGNSDHPPICWQRAYLSLIEELRSGRRNGITKAAYRAGRRPAVSLNTTAPGLDSDDSPEFIDLLEDERDEYERADDVDALERALPQLPEQAQRVLALRFNEDKTGAEVAEIFGVSESRISQIVSGALTELRAAIEGEPPRARSRRRPPVRSAGS